MGSCCESSSNKKESNFQSNPTTINNNPKISNSFIQPKKYDFELYKQTNMNKNKLNHDNNNNNVHITNISFNKIKTKSNISILNNQYNNIKTKNIIYYDDIETQEKYLANYKEFVAELNFQLSDLKDQLHISLCQEKVIQNILSKEENADLLNDLENISNNINQFNYLIQKQKNLLPNSKTKKFIEIFRKQF